MVDPREGYREPAPPLFLDQNEARRAKKIFFETGPPSLSQGLDDPPPPLMGGLDLPLPFAVFRSRSLRFVTYKW